MTGYLDEKALRVRERRLTEAPRDATLQALRKQARARPAPPSLSRALRSGGHVALIAEFKRRSPSAGPLAPGEDVRAASRAYEAAGAAALSVLTDRLDFDGDLNDAQAAAAAVPLPVLRKDFIVDEGGLLEARIAGSAAALLIMRILERDEPERLLTVAGQIGLECLVEVHDEMELERALEAGARMVGINNRDLQTLTTDLSLTSKLAQQIPGEVTLVSESGIRTVEDVAFARDAGAHAVLVGEALMRLDATSRRETAARLAGVPR